MDSITHLALGACTGELLLGKKLGKRAMLIGAVANSIPDIDFIAGAWLTQTEDLLAHRGFTHSFLFLVLASALCGLIAYRLHKRHDVSLKKWILFFAFEIFLHLFLDVFNSYGTGLFIPFDDTRISFNTIFVADPFFSIWIGIASIVLILLRRNDGRRRSFATAGLILSFAYLLYCGNNKLKVDDDVKKALEKENIDQDNYFTTPTPFNSWLWYVVAKKDSGFLIGYHSVFDKTTNIDFTYFPKNKEFLNGIANNEDLKRLIKFSQGYYVVQLKNDSLVFNDIRFQQIAGWNNPHADFVFHYYLNHPLDNTMVIQRGRFANWNKETSLSLIRRIKGE